MAHASIDIDPCVTVTTPLSCHVNNIHHRIARQYVEPTQSSCVVQDPLGCFDQHFNWLLGARDCLDTFPEQSCRPHRDRRSM